MEQLIINLPEFMQARAHSKDPEGTGATIDFLLSLTEFETFKTMMLASKQEGAGLELGDSGDANSTTLSAIVGNLKIDPAVVNRAKVLLQLGADGADVTWKKAGERPGSYLFEMTELGNERFMRVNSVMGLSLDHAIGAHCNWSDPDIKKYDDMWNEITVLKEERHGTIHDSTYKIGLKLPGVLKFVSSIPKTITMRCVVERDAPKPGSAIAMWVSWDLKNDCPDTGPLGFVRVALLESTGENSVRFINVSKIAPVMPTWVAGLFMSKTVMSGMIAVRAPSAPAATARCDSRAHVRRALTACAHPALRARIVCPALSLLTVSSALRSTRSSTASPERDETSSHGLIVMLIHVT